MGARLNKLRAMNLEAKRLAASRSRYQYELADLSPTLKELMAISVELAIIKDVKGAPRQRFTWIPKSGKVSPYMSEADFKRLYQLQRKLRRRQLELFAELRKNGMPPSLKRLVPRFHKWGSEAYKRSARAWYARHGQKALS